jgi:hypothetical protein
LRCKLARQTTQTLGFWAIARGVRASGKGPDTSSGE